MFKQCCFHGIVRIRWGNSEVRCKVLGSKALNVDRLRSFGDFIMHIHKRICLLVRCSVRQAMVRRWVQVANR